MNTIKLKVIQVNQPISSLFIAKIGYADLWSMSKVDRRHITNDDEVLGIQRELKTDKVKQIQKYLTTKYATFPNSIIVNVSSKNVVSLNEEEMELRVSEDTFTIIDGQHRLAGFKDYDGNEFELILTVFVDLEIPLQAEIFSTINSEQTKVDPSLNINLVLNDKLFTPRKMVVEIAQSFNYDTESPWYKQIKLLSARDDGMISLASFSRPLFDLTYPEKDWYLIKSELQSNKEIFPFFDNFNYDERRYIFWTFYKNKDSASVYKILWNYFTALKAIFEIDWLNSESILNKTTGYNAMMRLFKDIVPIGLQEHKFSYDFFFELLKPIKDLDGIVTAENYGSSGLYSTSQLYGDFRERLKDRLPTKDMFNNREIYSGLKFSVTLELQYVKPVQSSCENRNLHKRFA